jgi:hypothetical protein
MKHKEKPGYHKSKTVPMASPLLLFPLGVYLRMTSSASNAARQHAILRPTDLFTLGQQDDSLHYS